MEQAPSFKLNWLSAAFNQGHVPLSLFESTLMLKLSVVLAETPDARLNVVDSASPVPLTVGARVPAGKPFATESGDKQLFLLPLDLL